MMFLIYYDIRFEGNSDSSFSYYVNINGEGFDSSSNLEHDSDLRKMAVQEIGCITRSLVGQLKLTAVREQKQNPPT